MRTTTRVFSFALLLLFLLAYVSERQLNTSASTHSEASQFEETLQTSQETDKSTCSRSIETNQTAINPIKTEPSKETKGGFKVLQLPSKTSSSSCSRHLMCKDHDRYYNPINPTTIFRPSDTKAVCLTTVTISETIEFRWHHRSNTSKDWVSCYNWSDRVEYSAGEYYFASFLLIEGYWPGLNYPRAYNVDVYLDGFFSFSEFFEVTNGGLNSPRTCENVDANGRPVSVKSRFTIGADTKLYNWLRFDRIAYFNEPLGLCHNFTTVWAQPNGSVYKTHSGGFNDYKDTNLTWNYWKFGCASDDFILVDSNTPVGNWKIELYIDSYLSNNTRLPYGPIATTPFIIGDRQVRNWTFMVYLDADNSLESPGIDIFLKMANVTTSSKVNIVAQMDRTPLADSRYGNWTDCRRFNITHGMTPTPENAIMSLGEANMGDPNTLRDFVNWTIGNYPATYYLLVLWDHGAGCMGFCRDDTNASDALFMPELSQALTGLQATVDIVFTDACSMGMVEIAYQVKEHANILVAPEGVGYAPAPYDEYLSDVVSNSSIPPAAFARQIVIDYVRWCNFVSPAIIPNATMCAIDLTKMTGLAATMDDFALALEGKETPYHEQIRSARCLTERYPGPYDKQFDYYVDLRHFAEMASQNVPDDDFRDVANRLVDSISIGDVIIFEADKDCPNSYGLSVFFPNTIGKYTNFSSIYEKTAFTTDGLWGGFLENHLSGCLLTIETPYYDVPIMVNEDSYSPDSYGRVRVFVRPDYYTVNVTSLIQTAPDSRGIFVQWNDSIKLNPRIIFLNRTLTLRAEYETQYRLIIDTNQGMTSPSTGEHWYKAGSPLEITAGAPTSATGERYNWQGWNSSIGYVDTDNPATVNMDGPINRTATWRHEYYLTVTSMHGSPTPISGWFEAGHAITASIDSPVPISTNTRQLCTGWNGIGTFPMAGTNTSTTFTMSEPASITWNWKTQYLLVVRANPATIEFEPNVSPQGPWYDNGTMVNCTAGKMGEYLFDHWTVDGTNWDRGINPIIITMDEPYEATAYYVHALAWWENMFRPEILPILLGIVGMATIATVIVAAWILIRKKRAIVRVLSGEIDRTYSRLRSDPKKCEEELGKLKNKIVDASTEGKITEESHSIMSNKIDRYIEEFRKQKRQRPPTREPEKIDVTVVVLPSRVSTGFADLDNLLLGGLPEDRVVIMTSPPCDERDLLVRSFLETGVKKGEATLYLTIDATAIRELAQEHPSNFYVFVCNPKADETIEKLPNAFRLRGVENLTEINIALASAFRQLDAGVPKRACIAVVSDVLLQHGALSARRWLTALIPELRSNRFTTLAVINPQMHTSEGTQAILDLFDGEIAIYEKETKKGTEKVLKIKRLYDQRYLETELTLKIGIKKN